MVENIFTCCVCRDTKRAVIVHHIKPWSTSHDHRPENLAVLCLEHHDKAHSKSTLTKNLDIDTIHGMKKGWESEIAVRSTRVILEQSRVAYDAWWYFNHLRLFELAQECGVNMQKLPRFALARRFNLIDDGGLPLPRAIDLHYMYDDRHGMALYAYVKNIIEAVLNLTTICNISDCM